MPVWVVLVIVGAIIGFWIVSCRIDKNLLRQKELDKAKFYDSTLPCPTCHGRGRIPREGYAWTNHEVDEKYEKEMAVKDIPYMFRKEIDHEGR